MTEHFKCRHGLTLAENCDACELELARERDQRLGPLVDEARKVIAGTVPVNQCDGCRVDAPLSPRGNHQMPDGGFMGCSKDRYVETFVREGRHQCGEGK